MCPQSGVAADRNSAIKTGAKAARITVLAPAIIYLKRIVPVSDATAILFVEPRPIHRSDIPTAMSGN